MPVSSLHNGWRWDKANSRLDIYYRGTKVGHVSASELELTQAFDCNGAADFAADVKFNLTITAGADGVGADGEQLTSGGAAAECDWAAAGSLTKFKELLDVRQDAAEVLKALVSVPVYDFRYRRSTPDEHVISTGDFDTTYTGVVAEDAPWLMHHKGRILNPVNSFGYLLLAVKGLFERIEALEANLKAT